MSKQTNNFAKMKRIRIIDFIYIAALSLSPQKAFSQIVGPVTPGGPVLPSTRNTTYTYDACGNRTSAFSMLISINSIGDETDEMEDTPRMMKVMQHGATNILDICVANPVAGVLSLYDMEGRLWFSRDAQDTMSIDITDFRRGCYILQIEAQGRKESWTIQKR